jgi:hypothetical protein
MLPGTTLVVEAPFLTWNKHFQHDEDVFEMPKKLDVGCRSLAFPFRIECHRLRKDSYQRGTGNRKSYRNDHTSLPACLLMLYFVSCRKTFYVSYRTTPIVRDCSRFVNNTWDDDPNTAQGSHSSLTHNCRSHFR